MADQHLRCSRILHILTRASSLHYRLQWLVPCPPTILQMFPRVRAHYGVRYWRRSANLGHHWHRRHWFWLEGKLSAVISKGRAGANRLGVDALGVLRYALPHAIFAGVGE
jgi:hypothetical protein